MIFVKTFKGYEDKVAQLDAETNEWIHGKGIDVMDVKSVMSHEQGGRAGSGDLLYTVLYRSDAPIA